MVWKKPVIICHLNKIFIIILFLMFSYPLHPDTNTIATNETKTNLAMLSFEILKSMKEKYIIFESYDTIYMKTYTNENILELIFKGNVKISMPEGELNADEIRIIIVNNKAKQVIGKGNVWFVESGTKRKIFATKFEIDPNTRTITGYNIRTYFDNRFYSARKFIRTSRDDYILEDVYFTSCPLDYPHYRIHSDKVWRYKEDYFLSVNNTYQLGENNFLYIPFYFELFRYLGFYSALGFERFIGFYFMNTFYYKKGNIDAKLKLDEYEKLGEYGGVELKYKDLLILLDLAYTKQVFFDIYTMRWSPLLDPDGDGTVEELKEFAWRYKIKHSVDLMKGLRLDYTYENLNDPRLPSKFSRRLEKTDIGALMFPERAVFYGGISEQPSLDRNFNISYSVGESGRSFSINTSARWLYKLLKGKDPNPYSLKTYEYKLIGVNLPTISLSYNAGNILSYSLSLPIKQSTETTNTNITKTNQIKLQVFNFSTGFSASANMNIQSTYDEEGNPLYDSYNHSESTGINVNYSFFDLLKFSHNISIKNNWQKTLPADLMVYNPANDEYSTYTSLSFSSSFYTAKTFLSENQYKIGLVYATNTNYIFSPSIGFSISLQHNYSKKLGKFYEKDIYGGIMANSISFNTSWNFFKFFETFPLSFSTGFSMDLRTKTNETIIWEWEYLKYRLSNPLSMNFSLGSLASLSYQHDIRENKPVGYRLSINIGIKEIDLLLIDKIELLNVNATLYHSFLSPRDSSFVLNASTSISLHPLWKLRGGIYIENAKIHRYFREYANMYNEPYRDFWTDLLDSLKFWDIEARKRTFFKLKSVYINLSHDLHDWDMNLTFSLTQIKDNVKMLAYYQPYIKFEIKLKYDIGLSEVAGVGSTTIEYKYEPPELKNY